MTEALYLKDDDLLDFSAMVLSSRDGKVILDRTAFFPTSGGVMHDKGTIECEEGKFDVTEVQKNGEDIIHLLDQGKNLKPETIVHGTIDRERRHLLSRMHTAAHVLSAFFIDR